MSDDLQALIEFVEDLTAVGLIQDGTSAKLVSALESAQRYREALEDIAGTGTSMPPAAGNEVDHYRSVAWGVIGKASRALHPKENDDE